MALSKKYAALPDLDPAPEIYETPELTEDVSTIQTGTLRSESPSLSEEGRHDPDVGLDRQHIDRDGARRRFDRAVVDATEVDFSDRIGTDRRSYKISSRRRRRYRPRTASETDGSSNSEDESLPSRLARLRREAEELRIELEQRDNEDNAAAEGADPGGIQDDFSKLSMTLEGLQAPRRKIDGRPASVTQQLSVPNDETQPSPPEKSVSSIAAVSTFSDRLTSLESALGTSTALSTTSNTAILPTLAQLSRQIDALSSTLATSPNQSSSYPTLDELSTRVRQLVSETDKLTLSRKAALQSLSDLQEARLRNAETASYGHSRHISTQSQALAEQAAAQQKTESKLFLDEQAAKISALYELLPTINSLHPLLPTVLERLRSLQVIHAGAADARADLEEIEGLQRRMEGELKRWREGLQAVEAGMREHEQTSRANVEVVQQMVGGLEARLSEASR